jgi:hypothetical protein
MVPCVLSAVKSGAVSLIRGMLDVTGGTVAVLILPPDQKFVLPVEMPGQILNFAALLVRLEKTKPIRFAGWVSQTRLRYTHPGGHIQQQM